MGTLRPIRVLYWTRVEQHRWSSLDFQQKPTRGTRRGRYKKWRKKSPKNCFYNVNADLTPIRLLLRFKNAIICQYILFYRVLISKNAGDIKVYATQMKREIECRIGLNKYTHYCTMPVKQWPVTKRKISLSFNHMECGEPCI